MISVISCTNRPPDALELVERSLKRQTFKDWEWIVQRPEGERPKGLVWTLNRDYNTAIKKSKGDLIISWQDWTYAKPDTLEKFWTHYQQEPKTLVTAVGNKYSDDTWIVKTWQDPRERDDQGTFYGCYPTDIEGNLASIPRQALYDVGGFDEEMDKYYGMDCYNVFQRINKFGGYDFKIDQTIKSFSLEHGRLDGSKWDEMNWLKDNRYEEYVKTQSKTLAYL